MTEKQDVMINKYSHTYVRDLRAKKKRGTAAPLWMFSQRNNPYCDSLQNCGGKNRKKVIWQDN